MARNKSKFNKNSLVLTECKSAFNGEDLVVTLTAISDEGDNEKVGRMIGSNIMPAGQNPKDAVKAGTDQSACGNCPFRPSNYQKVKKNAPHLLKNVVTCYVTVAIDGIYSNWMSWSRGRIKALTDVFKQLPNKPIRMGSWGDPAMVPVEAWGPVLEGRDRTGYTHQWRREFAQAYKRLVQASCSNLSEVKLANEKGWFAYLTVPPGTDMSEFDGVECPYQATNKQVNCETCLLCDGTKCNVWCYDHGLPFKRRKITPQVDALGNKSFGETSIALTN